MIKRIKSALPYPWQNQDVSIEDQADGNVAVWIHTIQGTSPIAFNAVIKKADLLKALEGE